jgi:hypothetical protein
MSKLINGIFGLAAAIAAFGAVQLASGNDLGSQVDQAALYQAGGSNVNRAAKGDRAAVIRGLVGAGQMLSLQVQGGLATSAVMRLPDTNLPVETARNVPAPNAIRPTTRQAMMACEPVVSVLTAVAKQLPPGRCLS